MDFLQASVLMTLLDLAQDRVGGRVEIERASSRTVDTARLDSKGELREIVRSRAGPESQVVSSDLWMAVRCWARTRAGAERYVYRAEADVFPTAKTIVCERLERFSAGTETEADRRMIGTLGVNPAGRILRSIQIRAGSGAHQALIGAVGRRISVLALPEAPIDSLLDLARPLDPLAEKSTTVTCAQACAILGIRQSEPGGIPDPETDGPPPLGRGAIPASNVTD